MSVIPLGDAKRHLNISGSDHDSELQDVLDRAEGMIARRVGPLVPEVTVERVRPAGGTARLSKTPVASLTAVTDPTGAPVPVGDDVSVSTSGVIDGLPSHRYYDVSYLAGWDELPAGIVEGILAMTQHLWSTQRGGRRPGTTTETRIGSSVPGSAYVWPYRVTEAIADYIQVGV